MGGDREYPTDASEPPLERGPCKASIDLYWLPLGAGGHFVRLNGRIYEAIQAYRERRRPLDLYHSALEVCVPEGRFIIETAWPIPDAEPASRGVVVQGPVGSRRIARFRVFRYEVRRWRDGVIPDVSEAVASPHRLSEDPHRARRILDLVGSVPALAWGRDELSAGEMWNSNSVVSWLLARSGVPTDTIRPPVGGARPAGTSASSRPGARSMAVSGPLRSDAMQMRRRARGSDQSSLMSAASPGGSFTFDRVGVVPVRGVVGPMGRSVSPGALAVAFRTEGTAVSEAASRPAVHRIFLDRCVAGSIPAGGTTHLRWSHAV